MDAKSLLEGLNESQREAVVYDDGPSLVVAGAGSGKTRVLTYKIAYLMSQGAAPWHILALTFTNKAAREMKERIAQLVGAERAQRLPMSTFHSIFYRLLRTECATIGFPHDFTIYDAADSKNLVRTIVKEMGLDEKIYKPGLVAGRISWAKNKLMLPEQYAADTSFHGRDVRDGLEAISRIYEAYVARCRRSGAMDFDDLLLHTFLLLRDHPDVQERYRNLFGHILVDEFQDTNYAQSRILSLLTHPDSRICVVGDDAQSIYGFRGADIGNILSFTTQYPTARMFKLECNYRSTANIVGAANSVIRHNRRQIEKSVYAHREPGNRIRLLDSYSDKEEGAKVARIAARLHMKSHVPFSQIAILYRTNAQSRVFEEAFRAAGLPYRIYGGLSFYQRKEIKDILAYLRLIVNPNDEEALRRVINYPTRGIGATTQDKLFRHALDEGRSVWDVLSHLPEAGGELLPVSGAAVKKLSAFVTLIRQLRAEEEEAATSLYDFCTRMIRLSGIEAELAAGHEPEDLSRRENVAELLNSIKAYESDLLEETGVERPPLASYLAQISLLTDEDADDADADKVSMMTIHAAKGLEFDAVFVVGLEEDLFPGAAATLSPAQMEEERRLFYVALTRAKTYCYVSRSQTRFIYGKFTFCQPSPFLTEIDPQFVETERSASERPTSSAQAPTSSARTPSFSAPSPSPWRQSSGLSRLQTAPTAPAATSLAEGGGVRVGQHIRHERFGRGEVTKIEKTGESYKATVAFEQVGTKVLLLKFARFECLD